MSYMGTYADSCGIKSLMGLRSDKSPADAVRVVVNACVDADPEVWKQPVKSSSRQRPFIIYSGVVIKGKGDKWHGDAYKNDRDYCTELTNYIAEHGLGKVTASSQLESWTTNILQVFIWEPDYDALRAWGKTHPMEADAPPAAAVNW